LSCLRIKDSWSDWKKRKAVLAFLTSGAMLDVWFLWIKMENDEGRRTRMLGGTVGNLKWVPRHRRRSTTGTL
jgi:hypothetical protein